MPIVKFHGATGNRKAGESRGTGAIWATQRQAHSKVPQGPRPPESRQEPGQDMGRHGKTRTRSRGTGAEAQAEAETAGERRRRRRRRKEGRKEGRKGGREEGRKEGRKE